MKGKTMEEKPAVGHNGVSGERIKSYIERVERNEDSISLTREDIKDIYAEAKHAGFDTKIIKKIIRLKKVNPERAKEELEMLDLYASAAGIQLPLFS